MKALVAHASAHGSTREIAERIAQRLSDRGLQVETHSADDVSSLDPFDVAAIAGAMRAVQCDDAWRAQARAQGLQRVARYQDGGVVAATLIEAYHRARSVRR